MGALGENMSREDPSFADCARLEQLLLDSERAAWAEDDRAFGEAHLSTCAACRTELALLEELRFDGTAPAAMPLDDLARRRAITQLVAASGEREMGGVSAGRSRWIWAVVGLAACLVTALAVTFWPRDMQRLPGERATTPKAATALVLLRSGDALLGRDPLRLTDRPRTGQRIDSRAGGAALRLPQGSTLLLGAQTALTLDHLTPERVQVRLTRGDLLVSVTHRRRGQVFEVRTPSGSITVKGTAFSLYATGNYTALRVLRGVVRVQEPGSKARDVRPGRLVVLGKGLAASLAHRMGVAGQRRAARVLWLLPPVEDPRGHATLRLQTAPPGAAVFVDGTPVGITPLAAHLEPGLRKVTLRLAGRDTVRESISLEPAQVKERRFELKARRGAEGAGLSELVDKPSRNVAPVQKTSSSVHSRSAGRGPTARELLERAQTHRAARRWSGAMAAYRELIRRHPATPEGRAALVSLGIILLGPGRDAAGALRAFDRYLAITRRGDLAQEATFGRALALRRLGRRAAEMTALKDLLARWPRALQAAQARRRLHHLSAARSK